MMYLFCVFQSKQSLFLFCYNPSDIVIIYRVENVDWAHFKAGKLAVFGRNRIIVKNGNDELSNEMKLK